MPVMREMPEMTSEAENGKPAFSVQTFLASVLSPFSSS
jgi:hypothetical protein